MLYPPRPVSLGRPCACILCGAEGRIVLASEAGSLLVAACLRCDFDEAVYETKRRGWCAALEDCQGASGEWAEPRGEVRDDPCEAKTAPKGARPADASVVGVRRGFNRPPRRTRFAEGL